MNTKFNTTPATLYQIKTNKEKNIVFKDKKIGRAGTQRMESK